MIFQANGCADCDLTFFPPRAICVKCGYTSLIDCELEANSVVVNTEVLRSPGVSNDIPIGFGLVRLSNGSLAIHRI